MKYLIWSHRKRQWWKPDNQGYTEHVVGAGRYTELEAASIVFDALPGQNTPVDEQLAKNQFEGLEADQVVEKLDSYRNF